MFSFDKFVNTVYEHFLETDVTQDEIFKILDLKEDYNKDSPHSTGKRLKLKRLKILGEKDQNLYINYDKEIADGINVWIADNFKGKSSIFKVVKFALTGNNDLKEDVKGWIHEVFLEFELGNSYCIYISNPKGSRIKGGMYKLDIDKLIKIKSNSENSIDELSIVFEFNNNLEFKNLVQEFFFQQLSYYTLKWTQKSSQKDNLGLNEAKTSWDTYFKSIYLESKDYNTLFLAQDYGNQGQKIFEMILGLKFTYPINRLKIRRDY